MSDGDKPDREDRPYQKPLIVTISSARLLASLAPANALYGLFADD